MIEKELTTEDEIYRTMKNNWNNGNDKKLPPIFHGTDRALLKLTDEERNSIKDNCIIIMKEMLNLYKENDISYTDKRLMESKDSYGNSAIAYQRADARFNASPLYSYDDFYVTNNPKRAIGYAKEAWIFGETGWVTNRLVEGLIALDIKLPENDIFKVAYESFLLRKREEKDPVVIMICNSDVKDLYRENGKRLQDYYGDDSLDEIRNLKCDNMVIQSFRLCFSDGLDIDNAYLIGTNQFDKLNLVWKRL